jgi:hypothetical protein
MRSPNSSLLGSGRSGSAGPRIAPDEAKRESPEARSAKRDMRLLEDLRKLRRDRAEALMRDARDAVLAAQRLVANERAVVEEQLSKYAMAKVKVSDAIGAGGRSLEDIRVLLSRVDRSRTAAADAQSLVAALLREQVAAELRAVEASRLTQVAAAAHEKVLEWKKSA